MEPSLRAKLKLYKKRAYEIESYLSKKPGEWGQFQSEFNSEVNSIFRDIMNFEKENFSIVQEEKVYKLKKIFINRIRELFLKGVYNEWSLRKPFGYAGDFKIIDDIYQNNPSTTGFNRLFDNYFQMSVISVAVRNRKEDFKRLITDFISNRQGCPLKIMDLASGPCRELKEMLSLDNSLFKNVSFDCYENDERAIAYAKTLLTGYSSVNFIKENAMRIAFRKNINSLIDKKYDLIYATGLFDYFTERVAVALIRNLKKLLIPNGIMAIANVRDKYSNPSVHYMEWVGDWNLVYRDDGEFKNIFLEAGFREDELRTQYEQQEIMQYIIALNRT
ncbi:MAG: class I SAM-dependent methyltransferase [Candidatus Omnitrophica bacterium]|nr:class I SAM-dependent methyltransferase [Candidatus Omnitrophota bacterium]